MEIDWSVGEILAALKRHGLDERTLVIFTPTTVPGSCTATMPARPARSARARAPRSRAVSAFPALPAGRANPRGRDLHRVGCDDRPVCLLSPASPGVNLRKTASWMDATSGPCCLDKQALRRSRSLLFLLGTGPAGVRSGKWKLHFPHSYPQPQPAGGDGRPGKYAQLKIGQALYDLGADIGETTNLAALHPDVVARLEALRKRHAGLGDAATKREGRGVREVGRLTETARHPAMSRPSNAKGQRRKGAKNPALPPGVTLRLNRQ